MLAAVIATRTGVIPPPPPPILFYRNQLVAVTTTFSCMTITRQAAALTISSAAQYTLVWSGVFSILGQLQQTHELLISPAADDNPAFLSATIVQAIAIANTLNAVVQSLPVAPASLGTLTALQQRMLLAIRVLNSLAIPPNALSFS